MCVFRGRCSFIVYMRNKLIRYGFRVECLCDSGNGVVSNMEVYSGAGENEIIDLVPRLLPLENLNHRVFHGLSVFFCFV